MVESRLKPQITTTGLFAQETPFCISKIVHSPLSQIQKSWHETDLYLSSPSDSEGVWALEIDIYGCGFSYLVYYETADLRYPCTSSVSRRRHSNFSFIKGTEQHRSEHSCVCASLSAWYVLRNPRCSPECRNMESELRKSGSLNMQDQTFYQNPQAAT